MSAVADLPRIWAGEWISPVEARQIDGDRPAYLLEKKFDLDDRPATAMLFATALGVYEVFVNGRRVGDVELAPGSSNYDHTVYAQAYDVADHLVAGRNVVQIVLSDGWYRGRNGGGQDQNCWGALTAALAQLDIVRAGGDPLSVVSDASWTSRLSNIVRADLMTGQTTDFSALEAAPDPVRVGVVQGPIPTVSPSPPVRRVGELAAVSVTAIRDGVSIVDFGQNISGWARLTDLGPSGAETVLEFGEHVGPDGDLTTSHLDTHTPRGEHIRFRQIDRVISGGGVTRFEPRHTVHGFRYARVSHPGRSLRADAVDAVVVRTDLTPAGDFTCSDDRINRIHDTARRTFEANAVDVPTDCPTRERAGWTGDFQVFAPTAASFFDIDGFARKWLQAVRDDQFDDGCLAMISPDPLRMRVNEHPDRAGGGSAGWGDAAVAVPWTVYREYGDAAVLVESWDAAVAWIDYALGCARRYRHPARVASSATPGHHEEFIWDGPFHFGEWLEPAPPGAPPRDPAEVFAEMHAADQGEVGTAYLYRSLTQLAQMGRVLGHDEAAARYGQLAQRVRDAWRTEFLTASGLTVLDTQASYVRALIFGLIPEELEHAAASRLEALINDRDDHLGTGFLSTGMLLPALADSGRAELAYRLLTRTGAPSWLEVLERGGTTFWEKWEGVDEGGVARPGSLNHYSKGAVAEFLYTHILGLRQADDSVGWQRFTVRPVLGGGLTAASGTHRTRQGDIEVQWRREGDTFVVSVTAPPATVGEIILPGRGPTAVPGGTTQSVRIDARVFDAVLEEKTP